MVDVVDEIQCVVCGRSVARAAIDVVSEGPACAECATERRQAQGRTIAPLAWAAAALALVPLGFAYRTTTVRGNEFNARSTEIRLLIFRMSEGASASATVDGVGPSALVRTVFDPIAIVAGALALLVGAIAVARLAGAKPRSMPSVAISALAALAGVYFILHGLGKV